MAESPKHRHVALRPLLAAWFVATMVGMGLLWRYEMAPGAVGAVSAHLPNTSVNASSSSHYTLLLALHPHCPCSRATIRELNRIVTRCGPALRVTAFFACPSSMPTDWAHTDLWRDAAAIPNVTIQLDPDGKECQRLGAKTSGQAILY